eukprot:TRINITY_DN5043_c0_g1_i5.p2 TRINITY_DN5043_c0_g1~~TRINITY_DN5043_c0_g1_i5.p2  ORF type:complete len:282 (+),score=81.69 TRINITY_DN5043_c0_g1_i5:87-848(+)
MAEVPVSSIGSTKHAKKPSVLNIFPESASTSQQQQPQQQAKPHPPHTTNQHQQHYHEIPSRLSILTAPPPSSSRLNLQPSSSSQQADTASFTDTNNTSQHHDSVHPSSSSRLRSPSIYRGFGINLGEVGDVDDFEEGMDEGELRMDTVEGLREMMHRDRIIYQEELIRMRNKMRRFRAHMIAVQRKQEAFQSDLEQREQALQIQLEQFNLEKQQFLQMQGELHQLSDLASQALDVPDMILLDDMMMMASPENK